MSFSRMGALIIFVLVVVESMGQQSSHEELFRGWDKNMDGKIIKSELPQKFERNFERVDVDNNGFISLKEHIDYLSRSTKRSNQNTKDWTGFKIIRDVYYAGTNNDRQALDMALPIRRKSGKRLPVLAYIHGGAWRAGKKNGGLNRLHGFLRSGDFIGVTIGYRLSQDAKWPAQIHDCKAAIRWLKANAKKYNLDGDRIAVHGTSAGGHLASMLGTSSGVLEMDGLLGAYTGQSTSVRCVIDYFGPTNFLRMNDFESRIDHDAENSPESQLIGMPIQKNKKLTLTANPISYIDKNDAPFLIMHGTKDMAVPYNQSVILHKALKKAGVSSTLLTIVDGGHGGGGSLLAERFRAFIDLYLLNKEATFADESLPVQKN